MSSAATADPRDRRTSPTSSRRAAPATWPGTVVLLLVTAVGVAAFAWPFLTTSTVITDHSATAGWVFAAVMTLLGVSLLAEQGNGRLDATAIATLGVLAAMGAALRVLSAGVAGLEPVFFLVVLAGRVLGRRLAFLCGCLVLLAGAFVTGAVGPWTPFQMVTTGWVALGAALLPPVRGRAEVGLLAAYGAVAGLAYGAVMNLWFWPFLGTGAPDGAAFVPGAGVAANLHHYGVFYVVTSLVWDAPRALLTATLVLVAGRPMLTTLRRGIRPARFVEAP